MFPLWRVKFLKQNNSTAVETSPQRLFRYPTKSPTSLLTIPAAPFTPIKASWVKKFYGKTSLPFFFSRVISHGRSYKTLSRTYDAKAHKSELSEYYKEHAWWRIIEDVPQRSRVEKSRSGRFTPRKVLRDGGKDGKLYIL